MIFKLEQNRANSNWLLIASFNKQNYYVTIYNFTWFEFTFKLSIKGYSYIFYLQYYWCISIIQIKFYILLENILFSHIK